MEVEVVEDEEYCIDKFEIFTVETRKILNQNYIRFIYKKKERKEFKIFAQNF